MAIFHCHIQLISRSSGRSSVASSAYRSASKLHNFRDGLTHDFTKKGGVVYSQILLPENAPLEFLNREKLWNAVEYSEKRKDSQTAREIEIALPAELGHKKQIDLVREYIKENFLSQGMIADFALHDKQDGNPHAHIMLTTREVTKDGFGKKNRDWNDRGNAEIWRADWARVVNQELEKQKIPQRIDHRSFERQGLDLIPTVHLGVTAKKLEERGIITERGEWNRRAEKHREIYMLEKQKAQIVNLEINRISILKNKYLERYLSYFEKTNQERKNKLEASIIPAKSDFPHLNSEFYGRDKKQNRTTKIKTKFQNAGLK